jgi:hypothetical protein
MPGSLSTRCTSGERDGWAVCGESVALLLEEGDAARRDQPAGVFGAGTASYLLADAGVRSWPSM